MDEEKNRNIAIDAAEHVLADLKMLKDGSWVPDPNSFGTDCSIQMIEVVLSYLKKSKNEE